MRKISKALKASSKLLSQIKLCGKLLNQQFQGNHVLELFTKNLGDCFFHLEYTMKLIDRTRDKGVCFVANHHPYFNEHTINQITNYVSASRKVSLIRGETNSLDLQRKLKLIKTPFRSDGHPGFSTKSGFVQSTVWERSLQKGLDYVSPLSHNDVLRYFGIQEDLKIAIVHARNSSYKQVQLSRRGVKDSEIIRALERDSVRNSSITQLEPSIRYLLESGYAVIRVGLKSSEKIEISSMKNYREFDDSMYIDEASRRASRVLSIVDLLANAELFIGNASGPSAVASFFSTPTILFDNVDFGPFGFNYYRKDNTLGVIPKTFFFEEKVITDWGVHTQILKPSSAQELHQTLSAQGKYRVEQSSSTDILGTVQSALGVTGGETKCSTQEQKDFYQFFAKIWKKDISTLPTFSSHWPNFCFK